MNTSNIKIAVLCSGHLRSFKTTIAQLKECILNQFDCDLYLYAVSNEYESDRYINQRTQHDDLIAQLNPKVYMIEKASPNESTRERIKNMWFKIYMLNELRNAVETREKMMYTKVIRIRPDLLLETTPEQMKELIMSTHKHICVPAMYNRSYPELQIDTHTGYNDQFAVGPSGLMNFYCGVFKYMRDYTAAGIKNSSSLLRKHLQECNAEVQEVDIKCKLLLKENVIISVGGDSAAGKTTFCAGLKEYLSGLPSKLDVLILECDRYHKWERGSKEWQQYTHLHPEANQLDKMKDDIIQLKANNQIQQVDYDHHSGKFTSAHIIHPSSVVLVCGLHSLFDSTLNYVSDLKIYLDPDEQLQKEWKIQRDQKERGYSRQQVLASIDARQEDRDKYIKPQKMNADMIVSVEEGKVEEGSMLVWTHGPESIPTKFTQQKLFELIATRLHLL